MYRIAIVEDNPVHSDRLSECLTRYQQEKDISFHIETYSNGAQFLERGSDGFDVLFLDIEMPYVDGMSLAKKIREKDRSVIIIFVTNLTQFAINGYAVQALDYVIKPVKYPSFSITMSKVTAALNQRITRSIAVQNKDGVFKISLSSLYYVEIQKHNLIYHTVEGDITVRGTLLSAAKELGEDFAKCNNCYLVNLSFVTQLGKESVKVGPYTLEVSRRAYSDFFNSFSNYLERTVI